MCRWPDAKDSVRNLFTRCGHAENLVGFTVTIQCDCSDFPCVAPGEVLKHSVQVQPQPLIWLCSTGLHPHLQPIVSLTSHLYPEQYSGPSTSLSSLCSSDSTIAPNIDGFCSACNQRRY
ncbi:hypothetical protein MVEN_00079700 [Mycena venus]|uniref:Uncharacterized protein n=1 Tax=Mycena venus TaxID=2733690 RepID=A0A8H7DE72_9AGAR|nr:hypothetical protein MVEN_00079700 [Mycena venus]